jgi:aspartate kinase
MLKVTKFGGSSVSSAEQFKKVKKIIEADDSRRYVVVSAAGKRDKKDAKITDLLYLVNAHLHYHVSCDDLLGTIGQRLCEIARDLGLEYPISQEFGIFHERAKRGDFTPEFIVSRGEYFTAQMLAEYLGYAFVDATEVIAFRPDGHVDMDKTSELLRGVCKNHGRFVLPGFYGADPDGRVRLLDRGGGDITGAIVAACLGADLYENWTDVSGFLVADPGIVDNPKSISRITYAELRELSYMGASVLHEEAIFPVKDAGIPLNIRNTNHPEDPGTIISESTEHGLPEPVITGIAGKKDFVAVHIKKNHMSNEVGTIRRVLSIFERYRVSVEHLPSGIDSFAVVVQGADVADCLYSIVADIQQEVQPDEIKVSDHMALISTVGRNITGRPGVSGRLFGELGRAGVNIRMIAQGSEELDIIVGVNEADFERAIRVIYNAFVDEDNNVITVEDLDKRGGLL